VAKKAEDARDIKINEMKPDEKKALIQVFENYQKDFTKLKDGIPEDKLKKYLTENHDTLNGLEIEGFPRDKAAINGKNKDELITLAVAARKELNKKISAEFENSTIRLEDKKAFLKKYTDTDFSDSKQSIEFIKHLTNEELLLFGKYISSHNEFNSRDFIIRELSQHKLSLQDTLGLSPYALLQDSELIPPEETREALVKKYDPTNKDLAKHKEFVQKLTPAEFVFLRYELPGEGSKQSLLRTLEETGTGKTFDEVFESKVAFVSRYLEDLLSKDLKEINGKINSDPEIKAALIKSATPVEAASGFEYGKEDIPGKLYTLGNGYLVDFGDKGAKFYRNDNEILGLRKELPIEGNYFVKLAMDPNNELGIDVVGERFFSSALLRVGENARRLRETGTYANVLNNILEKIYTSEGQASAGERQWHKEMKDHVAKMLLAKDPDEFDNRRADFQKYLNDKDKEINGGFFSIDTVTKSWNGADAQTEQMFREVKDILSKAALGS
jgi:hypothetical protein